MQDQIAHFLGSLESERQFSKNTIAAYRNDLQQFSAFLASPPEDDAAIDAAWRRLAESRRAAFDATFGGGGERVVVDGIEIVVAAGVAIPLARVAEALADGTRRWEAAVGLQPPPLEGGRLGIVARLAEHAELGRRAVAIGARGQTAGGVAVLEADGRPPDEVEALALHELAHLLAERAFVRPLPVWLEEGIAELLARFSGTGPGRRRGTIERIAGAGGLHTHASGPLADLLTLAADAERGALPPLGEWTALTWREFVAPERRARLYALAGELAAFLLRSDADRAAPLRAVLARAAGDGEIDVDGEIAAALGDAATLDAAFRAWLVAERDRAVAAAGEP